MCSRNVKTGSRLCAHILKCHIAEIAIEQIGKRIRLMIHLHRIVENCGASSENILVPVVIEIENSGSPGGKASCHRGHTGLVCDIFKLPITQIAVERKGVAVHRSEKDIRLAIVVDIAEVRPHTCNSLTVFVVSYAGQKCDICKCSISI